MGRVCGEKGASIVRSVLRSVDWDVESFRFGGAFEFEFAVSSRFIRQFSQKVSLGVGDFCFWVDDGDEVVDGKDVGGADSKETGTGDAKGESGGSGRGTGTLPFCQLGEAVGISPLPVLCEEGGW